MNKGFGIGVLCTKQLLIGTPRMFLPLFSSMGINNFGMKNKFNKNAICENIFENRTIGKIIERFLISKV
jgi:hypothetical protein